MQTEQTTTSYGRRMIVPCLFNGVDGTAVQPEVPRQSACCWRPKRGQGNADLSGSPDFRCSPRLLNPVRRSRDERRQSMLACFRYRQSQCGHRFLKPSIRFGEIFAVFRRRAEEWTAYPINQPGVIKAKKKAPEPSPFRKPL